MRVSLPRPNCLGSPYKLFKGEAANQSDEMGRRTGTEVYFPFVAKRIDQTVAFAVHGKAKLTLSNTNMSSGSCVAGVGAKGERKIGAIFVLKMRGSGPCLGLSTNTTR